MKHASTVNTSASSSAAATAATCDGVSDPLAQKAIERGLNQFVESCMDSLKVR